MVLLPGCVCFRRSLWYDWPEPTQLTAIIWACGRCSVRPGVSECESCGVGFLAVFTLSNPEGH